MTTLAQALVAAQAEMPAVEPNSVNPHFKSKFVTLDHLIAKTRPVLNKHGLAIAQFPAVNDLGHHVLRTVIVHGESGERIEAETPLLLAKNDMQGLGSATTYARRYAWAAALGIAADEDDDGNTASRPAEQPGTAAGAADGEFRFPSGKMAGKTLAETPRPYLEWYAANGPKQEIRDVIGTFLALEDEFVPVPDDEDDIPF